MSQNRFADQNKRLSEFQAEVIVVCPQCKEKAVSYVDYNSQQARLFCSDCGYNKTVSTEVRVFGIKGHWQLPANRYFGAELWLKHPFKNDVFWAYNYEHLNYLEQYISATLREHRDRTHFTLLEKLPKFYHEAKNRSGILKVISKLKK